MFHAEVICHAACVLIAEPAQLVRWQAGVRKHCDRQRFRMICNQLKSMNVSIWVVAFATTLDSSLVECASNPNQAFVAADGAQLIQRFQEIGSNIGALRLTQ